MASENLVSDLFEIIQSNTKEKLSYDEFEKDLLKSINLPNDEIDRALSIMFSQAQVNPNVIGESKGGTFVISPSFSASVISTIKYENQFIEGKTENIERNTLNNKNDIIMDAAFAAKIIMTPEVIDNMIQNYSTLSNDEKGQLLDNIRNMSVSQIRAMNESINRSMEQLEKKDKTGVAKEVIISAKNRTASSTRKLDVIERGTPEMIDQEIDQHGVPVVVFEAEEVFTPEEMERLSEGEIGENPDEYSIDGDGSETQQTQPITSKEGTTISGSVDQGSILDLSQQGMKTFGLSNKRYVSQGVQSRRVLNDNPKQNAYTLLVERAKQNGTYTTAEKLLSDALTANSVKLRGMTIEISPQVIATCTENGIKIFNFGSKKIDPTQLAYLQTKVTNIVNRWGSQEDKVAILKESAMFDSALAVVDEITANRYLEITRACSEQNWDALGFYIGTDLKFFKAISKKFDITSLTDIKIALAQGAIKENELMDIARGLRRKEYDLAQKNYLDNDTAVLQIKDSVFGAFVPSGHEEKKEQEDRSVDRYVLEIKKAKLKVLTLGVKGESIQKALETYKEMLENAGEMILDGEFEGEEELIDFFNRESEEKDLAEEEKKVLKVLTQIKYSDDMAMFIASDSDKLFEALDKHFIGERKVPDKYIDGLVSQQGVDLVTTALANVVGKGIEEPNDKVISNYGYSNFDYKKAQGDRDQKNGKSTFVEKKDFFGGEKSLLKSVRTGQLEETTMELKDLGKMIDKFKEEKNGKDSKGSTEQDDETRTDDDEPTQ